MMTPMGIGRSGHPWMRWRRKHSSLKERGLVKPVPVWGLLFFLLFRPLFGRARRGGGVKDRPEADRVAAEGP